MTLDQILQNVLVKVSTKLDSEQILFLRNVLYVEFKDKEIKDVSYELTVADGDADAFKMQHFIASKKISGRSLKTIEQYVREAWECRNQIGKPFNEITSGDLRWYFARCQSRGICMNTLRNKRRYLNVFFKFLRNEGWIQVNPVSKIEVFKVENVIKKPFSALDMESLRNACETIRDRALIEFLYSTGVRVSELCSLKIKDLDWSKKEFYVVGKGRKERLVCYSDSAGYYINEYLVWRMEKENITFEELKEKPLFKSLKKSDEAISPECVRSTLKKIAQRANVVNVHPHRFRRTYASDLINRGMRLEEVKVLMGHTKMDTTLLYTDLKQDNIISSYRKVAA